MFRRLLIATLTIMLLGATVYGQAPQGSSPKKLKVKAPKKVKSPPVKKPKETPLTPQERAIRKANDKIVAQQRKAFEKENRQRAKDIQAQRKEYLKELRAAEKQARRK
jgi:hypothetical protein